jgi:CheY-like chemotaxis protein
VDDEKDVLNLFCEYLQNFGYQTISFDNPINALNYINNNISNCFLIITDYKMPQMSGIDFIKQIREKYSSNSNSSFKIKIRLISAFTKTDLNFYNELDHLKIDKIIEKPIRLEILREVKKITNYLFQHFI